MKINFTTHESTEEKDLALYLLQKVKKCQGYILCLNTEECQNVGKALHSCGYQWHDYCGITNMTSSDNYPAKLYGLLKSNNKDGSIPKSGKVLCWCSYKEKTYTGIHDRLLVSAVMFLKYIEEFKNMEE